MEKFSSFFSFLSGHLIEKTRMKRIFKTYREVMAVQYMKQIAQTALISHSVASKQAGLGEPIDIYKENTNLQWAT